MTGDLFRYHLEPEVPMSEVEASVHLAIWTCEALHGPGTVAVDAAFQLDAARRTVVIDAGTPVGRDFNRVLVGLLRREFGERAFRVERIEPRRNLFAAGEG